MKKLLKKAILWWGIDFQLLMLIEECAELIQAVSHYKRKREGSFLKLLEEIVDVEILIAQVKLAFVTGTDKNEYLAIKRRKIKRLKERLTKEPT